MPVIRTDLIEKTKNIVVSFKPDHGAQGKLSKETLLGKIKMAEQVAISKIREEDIAFIKNEKVRLLRLTRAINWQIQRRSIVCIRMAWDSVRVRCMTLLSCMKRQRKNWKVCRKNEAA